jgi:hypothetical protein
MSHTPLSRSETWLNQLLQKLREVIANIPGSSEPPSQTPEARCRAMVRRAAMKAAGTSGTLALPAGPWGLVTILPDLIAIWRVQAQLVADIAAAYGKTGFLSQEQMLYCLFRHAASQAVRDLIIRMGERVLIRQVPLRAVQQALQRVGIKLTQRLVGRAISRWLPIAGAAGVAAYAYYDTTRVGETAIDLFSREMEVTGDPS